MKTPRFLLLAGISLATLLTLSCDSLSKFADDLTNGLASGFTNINGNNLLQNGKLGFQSSEEGVPDGNTDVIKGVQISGNALSGGSTIITVKSEEQLEELYLQIEGESGFYQWILEDEDFIGTDGSLYVYQIVLEYNQKIGDENIGEIAEGDEKTLEFTISGKTKSGEIASTVEKDLIVKNVGSGALQISLSWDKFDDVDLYVYTPGGKEKLFFHKRISDNGLGKLDVDSNPDCAIDEINSENIFFEKPLEDGDYTVVAHLYRKCTSEDGARFNVTVNGALVTEKGKQFDKTASGAGTSLGDTPPTSSSTNVKLIGKAIVKDGQYDHFEAN